MRVLIVDDEKLIREVIREYCEDLNYQVFEAEDGYDALNIISNTDIDVIILDIMMPKKDGFQTMKELKQIKDIPVLMLSARAEEFDKLIGFDLGIDDYVTKPFSPKELVARVKAITKRHTKQNVTWKFGKLTMDDVAHEVKIEKELITLTPKEYELLKYLLDNENIALSRDKILNNVWNYDYYGDSRTIDSHIKKIRHKLGKKGKYIKTMRGVGYKFEVK